MTVMQKVVFALLALGILNGGALRADPAAAFFHARRALRSAPLPVPALVAAQQNPARYAGQTFEITARVGGLVSAGEDRTVLLNPTLMPGGEASVSAHLPAGLRDAPWIDPGFVLRALILVERRGNETSLSNLRLLAAAPEDDVLRAERGAPIVRAGSLAGRLASLPSRSWVGGQRGSVPAGGGRPLAALSPRALDIYGPYRDAIRRFNRRLSEADVDTITTWVLKASDAYDIDPRLVMAMLVAESGFDLGATSRTGAMGLGQLMPGTARGLGVTDAYDPIQNIAASVRLLRGHLDKYGGAPFHAGVIPSGQIALTMAAYNAGPGAVKKYKGVPPYKETQRYVARVTALYQKFCRPPS